MKTAYNETGLYNLAVVKESKRWMKQHFIHEDQYQKIKEAHTSPFYNPNFIIRILLFVATVLALSGVTGLLSIFVLAIDEGDRFLSIACIFYGIGSFVFLEKVF